MILMLKTQAKVALGQKNSLTVAEQSLIQPDSCRREYCLVVMDPNQNLRSVLNRVPNISTVEEPNQTKTPEHECPKSSSNFSQISSVETLDSKFGYQFRLRYNAPVKIHICFYRTNPFPQQRQNRYDPVLQAGFTLLCPP